ncbi:MAG: Crp/Fnr family transcriptional regulator [Firmicutes bacterium]|nr:Crp/Fnr family transcriptional regulator [Bacillota bacterium]
MTRGALELRPRRGQMIFCQGEASRELYAVLDGHVRIFRTSPEGAEKTLAILEEGDVFGELSAVDGLPRSATAQAVTDCRLVSISPAALMECVARVPGFAQNLLTRLATMLRETDEAVDLLAFTSARGRVASALLRHASASGVPSDSPTPSGLTQSDIAAIASTTRETVNRVLGQLVDAGAISISGRRYIVLDRRLLEEMASS